MAKNPMQRKANNSFILGILITLLITGIVIAFLVIQLMNSKKEIQTFSENQIKVYILKEDIKSGQTLTDDMMETKMVDKRGVPSNAFDDITMLTNYSLEDVNGNKIKTNKFDELYVTLADTAGNENIYVIVNLNEKYYRYKNAETGYNASQIQKDSATGLNYVTNTSGDKLEVIEINGKYYTQHQVVQNEPTEEYPLTEVPLLAKVDMRANTVLTNTLVVKSTERVTNNLRKQEYNMISLPSQIETGEYIDVRLRMPDGTDYIVVSHKEVEIPEIGGVPSETGIIIKLAEEEILLMSNSIVENYIVQGSELYATRYIEPGIQEKLTPTYLPSQKVKTLIDQNPNIIQTAKDSMNTLYRNGTNRNNINENLNNNAEDAQDNITDKVTEEITKIQEERQKYLESLSE